MRVTLGADGRAPCGAKGRPSVTDAAQAYAAPIYAILAARANLLPFNKHPLLSNEHVSGTKQAFLDCYINAGDSSGSSGPRSASQGTAQPLHDRYKNCHAALNMKRWHVDRERGRCSRESHAGVARRAPVGRRHGASPRRSPVKGTALGHPQIRQGQRPGRDSPPP